MIAYGINPEIIGKSYQQQTGKSLGCYNFGVTGATTGDLALLAEVVVKRYRPDVLIVGTSARDFSITAETEGIDVDIPWAHYQLGEFSLEGWLTDWSVAFRYYQTYRLWTATDFASRIERLRTINAKLTRFGFFPRAEIRDVSMPPDPAQDGIGHVTGREVRKYVITNRNRHGFEKIMTMGSDYKPEIIVLEMPLPPSYMAFFDHPQEDYASYIRMAEKETLMFHAAFIRAPSPDLFPDDSWFDYAHLNKKGANIYSDWLGNQLAELVRLDKLSLQID